MYAATHPHNSITPPLKMISSQYVCLTVYLSTSTPIPPPLCVNSRRSPSCPLQTHQKMLRRPLSLSINMASSQYVCLTVFLSTTTPITFTLPLSQSQISIMSFADSPEDAPSSPTTSSSTSSVTTTTSSSSSSGSGSSSIKSGVHSGTSGTSGSSSSSNALRQCEWQEGGPLFFDLHTKLGVSYEGGHWFHMAENFLTARSALRKQG